MEILKENSHLKFFQKTGVKIGFIPISANGVYETQCFHDLFRIRSEFSLADARRDCVSSAGLGLMPELVSIVMNIMQIPENLQILYPLNGSDYGTRHENGTWSGIVGDVLEGIYDTSYPILTPLPTRLAVIDFSQPVWTYSSVFTTR